LPTCWQQVVVVEFGKRHDTTDLHAPNCYGLVVYVVDLLPGSCQLVMDLPQGN